MTLGGEDGLVDPSKVIARMEYAHPLYTPASVAAQRRLPEADTERLAFAGAYHGWGFHEDGARSGVAAAARLGLAWPERRPETEPTEAQLRARDVRHPHPAHPSTTLPAQLRQPAHTWLVDLDQLPDRGPLARFEARDHLGSPARSIRANVDAFLADHGIDLTGGTVLMAANARAFGYCFNPISVFWCFDRDRAPAGVIVEVHNTYGGRHAYLVHPDAQGRARVDKAALRVAVPRHRRLVRHQCPGPGDDLLVAVTLHTDDGATFSVSLTGRRTAARAPRRAGGNPGRRPDPNATASRCGYDACRSSPDPTTIRRAPMTDLPHPTRPRPVARPRRGAVRACVPTVSAARRPAPLPPPAYDGSR